MGDFESRVAEDPVSVHTSSFPQLLRELRASVLVTTYQAGKLVVLREDAGVLNTHFRGFARPMGLAVDGNRLAIGCQADVWEFRNVPAVCEKLDASDEYPRNQAKHDACYLPHRSHCTGDIQVHEMAYAGDDLVVVNTAFSCLATTSGPYSFEPIWKPPFIQDLAPGDRCHLNGLAVAEGRIRYVTALGQSNETSGWRVKKRDGGVLLDVETNQIVLRGLSMPHSPRWHNGRLWLLESGEGTIGTVNLETKTYEPIAQLPGFTRGLSFLGKYAFIGVSQVRETAIFSGIPLVERLGEASDRNCGVLVLDLETRETVAFCRFEAGVEEIFAVQVLPSARFPDLINHDPGLIGSSYILSDGALAHVPHELKS